MSGSELRLPPRFRRQGHRRVQALPQVSAVHLRFRLLLAQRPLVAGPQRRVPRRARALRRPLLRQKSIRTEKKRSWNVKGHVYGDKDAKGTRGYGGSAYSFAASLCERSHGSIGFCRRQGPDLKIADRTL